MAFLLSTARLVPLQQKNTSAQNDASTPNDRCVVCSPTKTVWRCVEQRSSNIPPYLSADSFRLSRGKVLHVQQAISSTGPNLAV